MNCKTRQQLAEEYAISTRTLMRWLKRSEINLPPGLICPRQVDDIYRAFGLPEAFYEHRRKERRQPTFRRGFAGR